MPLSSRLSLISSTPFLVDITDFYGLIATVWLATLHLVDNCFFIIIAFIVDFWVFAPMKLMFFSSAANVSGVNVFWTIVMVFVLAGAMYGITGFIEGARIASCSANTGLNYESDAIAACVIGGVSFALHFIVIEFIGLSPIIVLCFKFFIKIKVILLIDAICRARLRHACLRCPLRSAISGCHRQPSPL